MRAGCTDIYSAFREIYSPSFLFDLVCGSCRKALQYLPKCLADELSCA
ncbi:MAG: hypothetical protein IKZ20_04230 [Bacteroidaceae bacterium]|nr:hypothetical protein [Bacteroidaceae bacterium]MBQ5835402.1 hypothetical protein [Bacteroidaceae bacterium]MBR4936364.1 hypothetical protein [Bacteroidaceae bacterium]MBR5530898.1 hypothetical protein [Bacteroidaceae bacterium]MBR6483005.1 hypothetical protein [Bacteroidaceae bacterium]